MIIKRLQSSWQLEQWRRKTSSFCEILSGDDVSHWLRAFYDTNRLQVLLSVQYYSVELLITGPLLSGFLTDLSKGALSDREIATKVDAMIPIMKDELKTAKELSAIIRGITDHGKTFLECNAAWWKCNYISKLQLINRELPASLCWLVFTVNLHLFGMLLACRCHSMKLSAAGISIAEVRPLLDASLKTLETFGTISLMSSKAGHCILGFLKIFDSLGK